jgi:hypothetical protein
VVDEVALNNIFSDHLVEGSSVSECDNEMIFSIEVIGLIFM